MEAFYFHRLSRSLRLFLLLLFQAQSFPSFIPEDNYLINCGSDTNTSVENRLFIADSTQPGSSFLATEELISLTNPRNPSPLYGTARIFRGVSSFRFPVAKIGSHILRFHFSPFSSLNYRLSSANFSVSVDGRGLLNDFRAQRDLIKEYILKLERDTVELVFSPGGGGSGIAFVNAVEVFSAPADLIVDDGVRFVGADGVGEFANLSSHVLEAVHRVNVGGQTLTSSNDTLWRNWVPDDGFLVLRSAAKRAVSAHVPNFQRGGATREIAPDNVYMTAREMNRDSLSSDSWFNVTWDFPLGQDGALFFVRLHFCDIVSRSLNQLYFDVFIDEHLAYRDLDLSALTYHVLSSPYYMDFVVAASGAMRVTVGPSGLSSSLRRNAILNGAEVMKIARLAPPPPLAKKEGVWVVVVLAVGGAVIICSASFTVFLFARKRSTKPEALGRAPSPSRSRSPHRLSDGSSLKMPFSDILSATNNFDQNLIIGSGGFGVVYRGILRNNIKVAVKRCVPGSRQGLPEFQTELTVLSRIRHRHLVSFVGYCEEQSEMILVYEFMERGSLKRHLYSSKHRPLSWKQRLDICIGAARGLHYLHTGTAQVIIHRDIKSTNILLDRNFVAKVADFGLSRFGPCLDESHVSTSVKGSFGYLDPEYFRRRQLSDKSDVYSFGVVLLEVLCGRPALDPLLEREQVNLAEWALKRLKRGEIGQIMDPLLAGQIKAPSLNRFAEMVEKCLSEYGMDRPVMADVLRSLEYMLQLQQSELHGEDDGVAPCPPVPGALSSREDDECGDDECGGSDLSTSKLFSLLMRREGR